MPPPHSASPRNPSFPPSVRKRKHVSDAPDTDRLLPGTPSQQADDDLERDLLGSSGDDELDDRSPIVEPKEDSQGKKKAKKHKRESEVGSRRHRVQMEFLDVPDTGSTEDTLDDELALVAGSPAIGGSAEVKRSEAFAEGSNVKGGHQTAGRWDPKESFQPIGTEESSVRSSPGAKSAKSGRPRVQRAISGFSSTSGSQEDEAEEVNPASTSSIMPQASTARAGTSKKQLPPAIHLHGSNDMLSSALPPPPLRTSSPSTASSAPPPPLTLPSSSSTITQGSLVELPHSAAITISSGTASGRTHLATPDFKDEASHQPDMDGRLILDPLPSPRLGGPDRTPDPPGSASPAPGPGSGPTVFAPSEDNGIVMAAIVKKKKAWVKPDKAKRQADAEAAAAGSESGAGAEVGTGTGRGKGKGKASKASKAGITTEDLIKMSMDVQGKPASVVGYGVGPGKAWRKGLKKGMTRADLPPDHPYHPDNISKLTPPAAANYLNPNFNVSGIGSPCEPFDSLEPPPGPSRTASQEVVKKKGGWPKGRPRGKAGILAAGLNPDQLARMGVGLGQPDGMSHESLHRLQKQSRAGSSDPEDYALDDGDASSAADGAEHHNNGYPRDGHNGYAQHYYGGHAQRPSRPIRYDIDPYAPADRSKLDMPIYTAHIPSKGIPIYKIPTALKGREKELAIAHPVREQLGPRPRPWALGTRVILGVGGAHLKLKSWMSLSDSPFEQARKMAAANAARMQYQQQNYPQYHQGFPPYPGPPFPHAQHFPIPSVLAGGPALPAYLTSAQGLAHYAPTDEGRPAEYAQPVAHEVRLESAAQSFMEEGEDDDDVSQDGSKAGGLSIDQDMEGTEAGDDVDVDEAMQELL